MKRCVVASSLVVVILALLLPALVGCASGGTYVEAKPQTSPQLTMPNAQPPALE